MTLMNPDCNRHVSSISSQSHRVSVAFIKKSQKTPDADLELAIERKKELT